MSRRSDWWLSLEPLVRDRPETPPGNGLFRVVNMRFRMNTRIYVSNLPETATEDNLRTAFGPFGTISKIFLATDRDTALPTYAFVTYATAGDMTASIEGMNEADFHGRKLAVSEARAAQVAPAPRRVVRPLASGPRRGPGGPARAPVRR